MMTTRVISKMIKMNYVDAKVISDKANKDCDLANSKLQSVPGLNSGVMGLTPDHVKRSTEYKVAISEFNIAFSYLRKVNAWFVKTYKKDYAADRKAIRDAKLNNMK